MTNEIEIIIGKNEIELFDRETGESVRLGATAIGAQTLAFKIASMTTNTDIACDKVKVNIDEVTLDEYRQSRIAAKRNRSVNRMIILVVGLMLTSAAIGMCFFGAN